MPTDHLLLTNDDGIDAPGLAALVASVQKTWPRSGGRTSDPMITVVAPDRGRSECGHSVTTNRRLQVITVGPDRYAVDGTPVDCVRVALATVCPHVDYVLSGINAGANLGVDLFVSGTFAAAREAAIQGRPAMAISHYRKPGVEKTWEHCPDWLAEPFAMFRNASLVKLKRAYAENAPSEQLVWNLNLPATDPNELPPLISECEVEQQPMMRSANLAMMQANGAEADDAVREVHFESDFHGRPRKPGSDVDVCFNGSRSFSRVPANISTMS